MLPKPYRFSLKNHWRKMKKEGKVFSGPLFNFVVSKQSNNEAILPAGRQGKQLSQFAFVVSTKISKKATVRNRLKRLLREAVRSFLIQISPGWMVVILAKQALVGKSLREICQELEKLFRRAQILL